jgi:hypothetical protein
MGGSDSHQFSLTRAATYVPQALWFFIANLRRALLTLTASCPPGALANQRLDAGQLLSWFCKTQLI